MPQPIGLSVMNLRELLHALREVDDSVIYYHLFQSRLAPTQPTAEYPNDFALWSATALQDAKLAEKLSALDPFEYEGLGQVRGAIVEMLDEYLWDRPYIPWARPGFEFHFCKASMVVMRSRILARTIREFHAALGKVGLDSVYYHFFEARWRLGDRHLDDFSLWIEQGFGLPELVSAVRGIDVYSHSLAEVRDVLLSLVQPLLEVSHGGA
jgi:hypothetical protein